MRLCGFCMRTGYRRVGVFVCQMGVEESVATPKLLQDRGYYFGKG